jgi:hypothetical protein
MAGDTAKAKSAYQQWSTRSCNAAIARSGRRYGEGAEPIPMIWMLRKTTQSRFSLGRVPH